MNTIKINSKEVKMIAHRGLSGIEKENTCLRLLPRETGAILV